MRNRDDGTDAVHDTTDDRDLIAAFNEASDPAEIARITAMARARVRARRREAEADAPPRPSRRRPHVFGRPLGFRH